MLRTSSIHCLAIPSIASPERGRLKLSELRRIDIETFGKIPRLGRNRSSWGLSRGVKSRGSGHGRGYGYAGRACERTVWSHVT
ncbi:hypothetical protein Acr_00g0070120 [Actinidia rufa]|uniref:TFG box profile domain-containing protein n=1 Tax=Actinidia rufa TaxID=165716 RepID=A0A7J0DSJ5_9ERIC|nr:hypothetical protein Acr_00g0070120 [Actinidia rufa]